jgi:lipopolysaccharide heptosyltransferase II
VNEKAKTAPFQIDRVIVRGTNWVGDAVMTIPALRQLRRLLPDAHISLASRSWANGLFAEADFIDDLITSEAGGIVGSISEARAWSRQRFDLAVILPNSFASALVPALARIPLRIGYATDRRGFLLTTPLALPSWRDSKHEAYYYLNIVSELEKELTGGCLIAEPDFSLSISSEKRSLARAALQSQGIDRSDTVIAFCPGSINSRAKRWPAKRYAELGDLIVEKLDAKIVLVGSPGEMDVASEVQQAMKNRPVSLTGKTSLEELMGILSQVDLLITNDTGPAHISAALGQPTLVIFGPTNPLTTSPHGASAQILRKPPDCAPCMLRDCPIDHRCMTAITVEDVFERAITMLNSTRTSHDLLVPAG